MSRGKAAGILFWPCLAIIAALSLLPGDSSPDFGIWDKFQHFGAYFVLMTLAGSAGWQRPLWQVAAALIAFSAGMEIAQSLSPGRDSSWLDLLSNLLGVICACVALPRWRRIGLDLSE